MGRDDWDVLMDAFELSPREVEVLRHFMAAKTERATAAAMGLSRATVYHHARNLYAKFRVKRRAQLCVRAETALLASRARRRA